jgi:hypothetical protein
MGPFHSISLACQPRTSIRSGSWPEEKPGTEVARISHPGKEKKTYCIVKKINSDLLSGSIVRDLEAPRADSG